MTYVLDGAMQELAWGFTAAHAHWLSGIQVRDAPVSNDMARWTFVPRGFGLADPVANSVQATSGTSGSFVYTGQT